MTPRRITFVPLMWPSSWPRVPAHERKPAAFSGDRTVYQSAIATFNELRKLRGIVIDSIVLTCGSPPEVPAAQRDPGAAVYFKTLRDRVPGSNAETVQRDTASRIVLACDRWKYPEENLWAICKHIEAVRGCERWGVGTAQQMLAGFAALPPSPRAGSSGPSPEACPQCAMSYGRDPCPYCGYSRTHGGQTHQRNHESRPATPNTGTWRIVLGFKNTESPTADEIEKRHKTLTRRHHPDAGGSHDAMAAINAARDEALSALARTNTVRR